MKDKGQRESRKREEKEEKGRRKEKEREREREMEREEGWRRVARGLSTVCKMGSFVAHVSKVLYLLLSLVVLDHRHTPC